MLAVLRFGLATVWIWPRQRRTTHTYDLHGILSVRSEVALPELERFRVTTDKEPTIELRVGGRHSPGPLGRFGWVDVDNPQCPTTITYDDGLGPFGF